MSAKRYDGSNWVDVSAVKRFDGNYWVDAQSFKRFDGASWVDAWQNNTLTPYDVVLDSGSSYSRIMNVIMQFDFKTSYSINQSVKFMKFGDFVDPSIQFTVTGASGNYYGIKLSACGMLQDGTYRVNPIEFKEYTLLSATIQGTFKAFGFIIACDAGYNYSCNVVEPKINGEPHIFSN